MRIRDDYAAYVKRAANVSVNQSLLEDAKALDINLSFTLKQALQQALQKEVRTCKRAQWLERSRDTINRNVRGGACWFDGAVQHRRQAGDNGYRSNYQ